MRLVSAAIASDFNLSQEIAGWSWLQPLDLSADGNVIVGFGKNPNGDYELWRIIDDPAKLSPLPDSDADGVCDLADACDGDDASGDKDDDGVCDDIDEVDNNESTGADVTDCPDDIVVAATSSDGAVVTFDLPTLDTASHGKRLVADKSSGTMFPIGTTNVLVYETDSTTPGADVIACSFNVEVTAADVAAVTPPDLFQSLLQGNCFAMGAEAGLIAPFAGICLIRRRRRKRSGR